MKKPVPERNWFIGAYKVVLRDRKQTHGGIEEGEPYLIRWHLLHTKWFRIMLHHIISSDPSFCPHDHPWNFWSIILRGGYVEHVYHVDFPTGVFGAIDMVGGRWRTITWYPAGRLLRRPAGTVHRLVLPLHSTGCWSLVVTGQKKRPWGFWSVGRWIPWRKFISSPHRCD